MTAYQLACGAVVRRYIGPVTVSLWKEHGKYHVRAHNHIEHKRIFWEVFDTLREALKCLRGDIS